MPKNCPKWKIFGNSGRTALEALYELVPTNTD